LEERSLFLLNKVVALYQIKNKESLINPNIQEKFLLLFCFYLKNIFFNTIHRKRRIFTVFEYQKEMKQ